ncbi:type II toxin-antitoxin system VapC family toxin [Rhizobium panacihumi]|uniref:type II toxin-antitoxin system VapC family toxin n=1 Tax=Rhizobium panacihumi TaxID=2008450 RepID=UPI003D7977C4
MNALLDTHALLWWLGADKELSTNAKAAIENGDNQRFISAVTAFEIANKFRLGKLPGAGPILEAFDNILERGGFSLLPVTAAHAKLAGEMPGKHRDPFDRLLAAQCKLENLTLLTVDAAFEEFGIDIVW